MAVLLAEIIREYGVAVLFLGIAVVQQSGELEIKIGNVFFRDFFLFLFYKF